MVVGNDLARERHTRSRERSRGMPPTHGWGWSLGQGHGRGPGTQLDGAPQGRMQRPHPPSHEHINTPRYHRRTDTRSRSHTDQSHTLGHAQTSSHPDPRPLTQTPGCGTLMCTPSAALQAGRDTGGTPGAPVPTPAPCAHSHAHSHAHLCTRPRICMLSCVHICTLVSMFICVLVCHHPLLS